MSLTVFTPKRGTSNNELEPVFYESGRGLRGHLETDFIDVVAWRNTAEFVSKYFSKGRMAVVEGRLQLRDWTDKDGNKRRTAEIVADSVYFGDSKRDGGDNSGYASAPSGGFNEIEDDGDLPF